MIKATECQVYGWFSLPTTSTTSLWADNDTAMPGDYTYHSPPPALVRHHHDHRGSCSCTASLLPSYEHQGGTTCASRRETTPLTRNNESRAMSPSSADVQMQNKPNASRKLTPIPGTTQLLGQGKLLSRSMASSTCSTFPIVDHVVQTTFLTDFILRPRQVTSAINIPLSVMLGPVLACRLVRIYSAYKSHSG